MSLNLNWCHCSCISVKRFSSWLTKVSWLFLAMIHLFTSLFVILLLILYGGMGGGDSGCVEEAETEMLTVLLDVIKNHRLVVNCLGCH